MEHVQHMHGLCMQYVGGIGHGGCPARSLQDSRPPRTYRVHSAYSWTQKGNEGLARAWPAAIWGHGVCMEYLWNMYGNMSGICKEYVWNMHGISMEYLRNMYGIHMEYVWNMSGISKE